ncbi:MAG TPA: sulfate adenylyltransferase subunit CysN [Alphaproteobacteria bacterium]|jgi:bifunctional enzyme CysN/CysC
MDTAAPSAATATAAGRTRLRLLTCGSVDDGKSTLIGRLLYDIGCLADDHAAALAKDSARGSAGGDLDFALLLDGLEAEREQGITIDVAYRHFASARRAFIVADAPGHEQYTRNMATGASNSELAVILCDARKGVLPQTRRHSCINALLGIKHVVLVVNKMDLVGYDQAVFERIAADYRRFVDKLKFASVAAIPLSARFGDNVARRSVNMPWYEGPAFLELLETLEADPPAEGQPFRMPIQWVNRPNQDFRGYAGTVARGRVRPGDPVAVAHSGVRTRIARIVTAGGDLAEARAGDAVVLVLESEIDASRGDMLAAAEAPPPVTDQFAAHLIWFADEPMLAGRRYIIKAGTKTALASITSVKHRLDIESLGHAAARELHKNDIGLCNISVSEPLALDPYDENRATGSFVLIDRFTNATAGAGMVEFPLRRASNIHRQETDVDKAARAALMHQKPACLWFTGLSGAGKSTIANLTERKLHALGRHTYLLDGDNLRHGLNRDLGFLATDRVENMRRAAEVAKLMIDAGLIVLVALISPFRAERQMARETMGPGEFVEIHVDAPIEICRRRDPKGLYRKADAGGLANFTGIDSPYEPPEDPEVVLRSAERSADDLSNDLVAHLRGRGIL